MMHDGPSLLFLVPEPGAGTIWTGTGGWTDALAVADGRIVAFGGEARDRRTRNTEVVDLTGRALLPAFRDGHIHPLNGGAETLECDLVDAGDVEEVLRRLASHAIADPDSPWVLGYGYPPELLPGGVGRAATLDTAVADRPVALWSSDHHMVWCNSRALEIAGITASTVDPPRGTIVRDADGHPVGTLLEEAELLLSDHLPPRGVEKEARGLQVGLERMATAGIVWGQDARTTPELLASYQRVAEAGALTADLDLAFKVEVDRWQDQIAAFEDARRDAERAAAGRASDGVPGGRVSATTVKFFVDGVIEGGTGALLEPYCAFGDQHTSGHDHGIANWDPIELARAATAMDAAGFQLHLHVIGDAAVRMTLDAMEAVAGTNGPADRRPVLAHTHLVHPDDLPRFRSLGVIANFEPLWAQGNEIMRDLTIPRLGPERVGWQYPIGSLVRGGARVSFGSDWPVSSHVPLRGIEVAVTRRGATGPGAESPFLPEQAITLDQALAAYTSGTAFQAGEESAAGTLTVGKAADLVVTSEDVTRIPPGQIHDVEVAGTWLRGAAVHRRAGLAS
jgi:predicted amidohydrolase YtcJ